MKAAGIFSVASMAVSAMAAPLVGDLVGSITGSVPVVGPILSQVDAEALIKKLPVGDALDKVVSGLPVTGTVDKIGNFQSKVTDVEGVVVVISGVVEKVKGSTSLIKDVLAKVESGDLEKSEADAQVIDLVETIQLDITEIVTGLTGAVGITVLDGDVDRVLSLVTVLVKQLLGTVNVIVSVLGLRPQLTSLLHSVFVLLANVLTLVVGLVGGLAPGLVAALAPLLAGVGGILAPVLTPVVALVGGIAGI